MTIGDRDDHRKHAHHHKPDWKHDRHDRKQEQVKHHQHQPAFHRANFERPERMHRPEKVERPIARNGRSVQSVRKGTITAGELATERKRG